MAKNNAKIAKNSKFFYKGDIIIYIVLVIVIALSFLTVSFFNKEEIEEIAIYQDNIVVATYNVATQTFIAYSEIVKYEEDNSCIVIQLVQHENKEHNYIQIEKKSGKTTMTDADCSDSKDCVHMPPITKKGGIIVCLPHHIIIKANGTSDIIVG